MQRMGARTDDTEALDADLRTAITERRLIAFELAGHQRIAEPHDYGVAGGKAHLLFYQVGGFSSSGKPFGWRSVSTAKLENVRILNDRFGGPRRTPTERHKTWDVIIASVSMPPGPAPSRR
jgi:hypothetical protein